MENIDFVNQYVNRTQKKIAVVLHYFLNFHVRQTEDLIHIIKKRINDNFLTYLERLFPSSF